jgi:hypothetical protein
LTLSSHEGHKVKITRRVAVALATVAASAGLALGGFSPAHAAAPAPTTKTVAMDSTWAVAADPGAAPVDGSTPITAMDSTW